MSCSVAKFTITKGVDNTFLFTIKADGSTLPMEITGTDTFVADLVPLDPEDTTTTLTKPLTLADAANGKVALAFTAEETSALVSDKGAKTDRYYLRPTYRLIIECNTANNGNFIAKVPEVYVD